MFAHCYLIDLQEEGVVIGSYFILEIIVQVPLC